VSNFGVYASPERRLVFDLNDFDETLRAPFDWDVKRMSVSLLLAAQAAGLEQEEGAEIADTAVAAYIDRMRDFAARPTLDAWYARIDRQVIADMLDERSRHVVDEQVRAASRRTRDRAIAKFVERTESGAKFRDGSTRMLRLALPPQMDDMIEGYQSSLTSARATLVRRFRVRDLAFRAVGVGSVGTRCFVALLDTGDPDDLLILQIKEAVRSVLHRDALGHGPSHEGRRVVTGQNLMQAVSDILLGWTTDPTSHRHYYVRQLWDMKGDLDLSRLDAVGLAAHGRTCGWALAHAHARTGDPVAIAAYLGAGPKARRAFAAWSAAYLPTVASDAERFQAWLADGAPPAETSEPERPHPLDDMITEAQQRALALQTAS
jgi:uncharacterized protein (DUF2252 family)